MLSCQRIDREHAPEYTRIFTRRIERWAPGWRLRVQPNRRGLSNRAGPAVNDRTDPERAH